MNQPIAAELGSRVFIAIGAGDRERPLKQNYPYEESVENRFYVFIDKPLLPGNDAVDLDAMLNAATGLPASLDDDDVQNRILDYDGWYLDLPDQGEQIVNQAAIAGGYVFFNSFQAEGSAGGYCRDLGTAKSYAVPLFNPEAVEGEVFGEGVPIPPIIVTVDLDSAEASCTEGCGPGEITEDVRTVIIGLKGFEVIDISPDAPYKLHEAYRVENIDRL
jgi:type IV pilus assembly protein PilY1